MIIAKIFGVPKAIHNLQAKGNQLTITVEEAIERASILVKNRAKNIYLRGPRPKHLGVVSANLWDSIKHWKEYDVIKAILTGKIGTNVWYGGLWESGKAKTPEGKTVIFKKTKTRPFLKPALADVKPYILEMFKSAVGRGVK